MSEDQHQPSDAESTLSETLDRNLEALLTRSMAPPRLAPESRARIREHLLNHAQSQAAARLAAAQENAMSEKPPAVESNEESASSRDSEGVDADSKPAPERAAAHVEARRAKRAAAAATWMTRGLYASGAAMAAAAIIVLSIAPRPAQEHDAQPETSELSEPGERPAPAPVDDKGQVVNLNEAKTIVEEVSLPDGTKLVIDAGVSLEQLGPRHLRLGAGRVLFDVKPGATPFIIDAPQGRVVVTGTRLMVDVDEDETQTVVLRGTVDVDTGAGKLSLRAGESSRMRSSEAPQRMPAPRLSHVIGWAHRTKATRAEDKTIRKGNLLARDPVSQSQEWPLPMRNLTVDAVIEDQMARVTIDQTFFNHTNRQLEGVYSFPLPHDAAVARLAMYVDGKLMEGGIVERQRGREVYEGIVYRRRDPALLEWMKGNLFKVRIFPLPAREEKRIFLSYTQSLRRLFDRYELVVPIPEVDVPVDSVSLQVRLRNGATLEVNSNSHEIATRADGPDKLITYSGTKESIGDDLVLSVRDPMHGAQSFHYEDQTGRYFMARVQPELEAETVLKPRRWLFLHDTSASRGALELQAQAHIMRTMLEHIDTSDEVNVMAFDTIPRLFSERFEPLGKLDLPSFESFVSRQSLEGVGATDLAGALKRAMALVDENAGFEHVLVYVGDGVLTDGSEKLSELQALLAGKVIFVGVGVGEQVDASLLGGLAASSGGYFTTMSTDEDLDWRAFDLFATLSTARVVELSADLVDAAGVPLTEALQHASVSSLAQGDALTVIAKLSDAPCEHFPDEPKLCSIPVSLNVRGKLAGKAWHVSFPVDAQRASEAPYLPRQWARTQIAAWLPEAETHEAEMTALGMEHFLVTPFTSLLVLENDAMYAQYKVNRGSEKSWARYPAPKTIEVVREPVASTPSVSIDFEALLLRLPVSIWQDTSYGYRYAENRRGAWDANERRQWGGKGGGGTSLDSAKRRKGVLEKKKEARVVSLSSRQSAAAPVPTKLVSGEARWDSSRTDSSALLGDSLSQDFQASNRLLGADVDGRYYADSKSMSALASYGQLSPAAFQYLGDDRLYDPTEFLPGFFADAFDFQSQSLLEQMPNEQGSISDEATARLGAVLQRRQAQSFSLADGGSFFVRADGSFMLQHRTRSATSERVYYDGNSLYHVYDEFGLALQRRIAELSPVLYARWVPFVMPSIEHLRAWYDVSLELDTLRLTPIGGSESYLELQLDADDRIVALRSVTPEHTTSTDIEYDDAGITVVDGTHKERFLYSNDTEQQWQLSPSEWTMVELPLRTPEYWEQRLASTEKGSEERRRVLRQLMASCVSSSQNYRNRALVDQVVAEYGALSRGELTLSLSGSLWAEEKVLRSGVSGMDSKDPLVRFLWAARSVRTNYSASALSELSGEDSLLGMLASHAKVLGRLDYSNGSRQKAYEGIESFAERFGYAPLLAVQIVLYLNQHRYQDKDGSLVLIERLAAIPGWETVAAIQRIYDYYYLGEYDLGAREVEALYALALERGEYLQADYNFMYLFTYSSGGHGAFKRFAHRWGMQAAATGKPELLSSALGLAMLADQELVDFILSRFPHEQLEKPEVAETVIALALETGRPSLAVRILEQHLSDLESLTPSTLRYASYLYEQSGNDREAAKYLKACVASDDELLSLEQIREDARRLLEISVRLTLYAPEEKDQEAALREALWAARQWRLQDPDNVELDQRVAQLFSALERPEEAWRYLSSSIERHPGEGLAYGQVAEGLESLGEMKHAEKQWSQAVKVEPTNPTWRLSLAHNLLTQGRNDEATQQLELIAAEKWQDRFWNVKSQADQMLKKQRLWAQQ
ncbi:MAG: VIT domain-containing protein [Myxococcota bacterium]|jgi:hypothetical protein|nr:VIT domain-containing protein [Myxococcota bacterium]